MMWIDEELPMGRRQFVGLATTTAASLSLAPWPRSAPFAVCAEESQTKEKFQPRYILASCMYGYAELAEILPEVHQTGATAIDIWPQRHGNQREQLDEMGEEQFVELLKKHNVSLGCLTQYRLTPFTLENEMRLAGRLNCPMVVSAVKGQSGLRGQELKTAVKQFTEAMKPHLEVAAENDVTISIENHPNNLIESADSLKWLAEFRPNKHLSIAFAPYHLEQDSEMLATLINTLGTSITMFYVWEHGRGSKKLPPEQEILQMPGRGTLDFAPLCAALRDINYQGWTSIFMHPYPRGKPIRPTTAEVTAEINRSRKYLANLR